MELTPGEKFVVEEMRKYGPYANFTVEKRPTQELQEGELVAVTAQVRRLSFARPKEWKG